MLNGVDTPAILSTLPIVGPIIGAFNVIMVKCSAEISTIVAVALEEEASSAFADGNDGALPALVEEYEDRRRGLSEALRREIIYSKAAFIGTLINLIGVITLIACRIFSGPLAVILTSVLAVGSIAFAYNAYRTIQDLACLKY